MPLVDELRAESQPRISVRGGYPLTYQQAMQMATTIAAEGFDGARASSSIDDIGTILNLVNDMFLILNREIHLKRILNKYENTEGHRSTFFLSTTPLYPVRPARGRNGTSTEGKALLGPFRAASGDRH
ncbi:hypothetical protein OH77DRAFT_1097022 [Trametes cingulata]|nr:hypothetical protein OH77DRAFT_1097022 [Trametes cingulata]